MKKYLTDRIYVRASRHRASSGFTLIELMIAMLLGLLVIAGVVSVFLAAQQSYRTNVALGDVQASSRIAFEMMAHDIREAGLSGCANNGRVSNVLNNGPTAGGTDWFANLGNAVHGYGSGQVDPAIVVGTAPGTRVSGTDSLQLIGTGGTGLSIATDNEPAANFKLNDTTTDLQSGDIVIVCDPDHAAIVQISNYNSNNVTFVHNTGNGSASPGNCTKGLGFPAVCTTNGNSYTFGANSQIAKLVATDWYIGNNSAGGSSLYRSLVATNSSSVPTATPQEMIRNVTGMTITYHQAQGTSLLAASAVTQWSAVDAVRVYLTVQSTDQRAGTDTKALSRNFYSTTTVRNRVK